MWRCPGDKMTRLYWQNRQVSFHCFISFYSNSVSDFFQRHIVLLNTWNWFMLCLPPVLSFIYCKDLNTFYIFFRSWRWRGKFWCMILLNQEAAYVTMLLWPTPKVLDRGFVVVAVVEACCSSLNTIFTVW